MMKGHSIVIVHLLKILGKRGGSGILPSKLEENLPYAIISFIFAKSNHLIVESLGSFHEVRDSSSVVKEREELSLRRRTTMIDSTGGRWQQEDEDIKRREE